MAIKTVSAYANVVTEQYNPNTKQLTHWQDKTNMIGGTGKYATAQFTKETYVSKYKEVKSKDKNGKQVVKKVPDKYAWKYNYPWTLSAHDFGFDIPSNASIKSVKFKIRLRADYNVNTKRPTVRFNIYGTTYANRDDKYNDETGWHNGVFYYVPNLDISSKFETLTYTMDEENLARADLKSSYFNRDIMGADFIFHQGRFEKSPKEANAKTFNDNIIEGNCYVEWVQCVIEYEVPEPVLSFTNPKDKKNMGSYSKPYHTSVDEQLVLDIAVRNEANASGENIDVEFKYPHGAEITFENTHGTYDSSTNKWNIRQDAKSTKKARLIIVPHTGGKNFVSATIGDTNYKYYFETDIPKVTSGYGDVRITPIGDARQNCLSCFDVDIEGFYSNTNTILATVESPSNEVDYENVSINWDKCTNIDSADCYINQVLGKDCVFVVVAELIEENKNFAISFRGCLYPKANPLNFTTIVEEDDEIRQEVYLLAPYTYIINSSANAESDDTHKYGRIGTDVIKCVNHRVVSQLGTNATIIPCVADDKDSVMIMSDCRINMNIWEDLDYIGCVPLEHLHFNPKSTYKDTLINSSYKNKRYMGKKLATDEDISLNVRLHPQQVTTIQGLIDMDKPIPINANHRCFEGDALNHRGWCEIYSIKAEETNPSWYKCDIDVKYLTHNLNTRFKIDKGEIVQPYDIPKVYTEVFSSGESLSTDEESFFVTDTDGTYYYNPDTELEFEFRDEDGNTIINNGASTSYTYTDDEGETVTVTGLDNVIDAIESQGYHVLDPVANEPLEVTLSVNIDPLTRNNFNIDNGQHITITTRNPLAHTCSIKQTWSSTILNELRENHISRISRLIDRDTKEVVFEYEYDNIVIDGDEVTADVIYRVRNRNGLIDSYNLDPITFRFNETDVSSDEDTDEEYDSVEDYGDAHFGTSTYFNLNNSVLSIIDEGFNGREVAVEGIGLLSGDYLYQVEWINNNLDSETPTVDCMFDFEVMDTVLTTNYSKKFENLVVSPFPVTNKKLLFTREAEEGTIFYYDDDGEEFSYLVEPYYMYHNGTDLVTNDGISIFNLNYGYRIVYIQNGLVRLGFNRVDERGYMYLGKYDPISDRYITTNILHLGKYADVNLNTINDDKIEVQASDCTFTIYRGHPYIKVKHETEDILIDTLFTKAWSEKIGGDNPSALPSYWELGNDKNLLQGDIGGSKTIKTNNIEVYEDTDHLGDKTPVTLAFSNPTASEYVDTDIVFTVTGSTIENYSDILDLEDNTCSFGTYEWEILCDNVATNLTNLTSAKSVIQTGETTKLMTRVTDSCGKPVEGQTVSFYEEYTPTLYISSNKSVIQTGDDATISIKLKDTDGSIISLDGKEVRLYEVITPQLTISGDSSIVQSGSTVDMNIKMKDSSDGNIVPLTDMPVRIYEQFTGLLKLKGDKSIVQTSGNVGLSAQMFDATDGSQVKYDGLTVGFYKKESGINLSVDNDIISEVGDYPREATVTIEYSNARGVLISGKTVGVYVNGTLYDTVTTNAFERQTVEIDSGHSATLTISAKDESTNVQSLNNVVVQDYTFYDKTVSINWDDNDNEYNNRPSSVTITLTVGGSDAYYATLNSANDWSYTFEQIPNINYGIEVSGATLYNASVSGNVVTLTENNPTKTLTVSKVWNDNDNEHGVRPTALTVTLDTGESMVLSYNHAWVNTITVPTYRNGEEHEYSWTEATIENYGQESKEVDGDSTVFTNYYSDRPTPPI